MLENLEKSLSEVETRKIPYLQMLYILWFHAAKNPSQVIAIQTKIGSYLTNISSYQNHPVINFFHLLLNPHLTATFSFVSEVKGVILTRKYLQACDLNHTLTIWCEIYFTKSHFIRVKWICIYSIFAQLTLCLHLAVPSNPSKIALKSHDFDMGSKWLLLSFSASKLYIFWTIKVNFKTIWSYFIW